MLRKTVCDGISHGTLSGLKKITAMFGQHRIFGGAVVLAVTQVAASVAGLARDHLLNRTFPGLGVVDVYFAAFRPSDLLFQMTIMAAYSVALVPLLAKYRATEEREGMNALLNGVMGLAALVFGAVALVMAVVLPYIAGFFVQFEGPSLALYVSFGRIALLTNFLFVFGNALGQYFITVQRYWIYGITPVLYTLGTVFGTVFLTPYYGELGPILGTLIGAFVYVLVRLAGAWHSGYRPGFSLWHTDIHELGWLMLPRMIALGILQLELLFFDRIASGLSSGSITINSNARNFQSVVVGAAGIALAQSAFSLLSQAAAKKEHDRFLLYLRKGIGILLLLTVPGAIVLWFMAPVAAALVHLSDVLPVFGVCLGLYAISIPFESLNHLLLRSFYALKDTTAPAIVSVVNGLVAIAVSWWAAPLIGVYALALGFTIGQLMQVIALGVLLPMRLKRLRM